MGIKCHRGCCDSISNTGRVEGWGVGVGESLLSQMSSLTSQQPSGSGSVGWCSPSLSSDSAEKRQKNKPMAGEMFSARLSDV